MNEILPKDLDLNETPMDYTKESLPEQAVIVKPTVNKEALQVAMKLNKNFEGCSLVAYPDPESNLYKAMSTHNMVQKWMRGDLKWKDLPEHFQALSGAPWTIGYGYTGPDVKEDTVWTQLQADSALEKITEGVMAKCLKDCPKLVKEAPVRIGAITSLAYNIGNHAFATSTACREIEAGNMHNVGADIRMWNRANGLIEHGLDNRRKIEESLWNSVG